MGVSSRSWAVCACVSAGFNVHRLRVAFRSGVSLTGPIDVAHVCVCVCVGGGRGRSGGMQVPLPLVTFATPLYPNPSPSFIDLVAALAVCL